VRYGIVVHGPEAVDSGMAMWFLDRLSQDHVVEATLGGAMGLAAVLDAGLEERIDASKRELVSEAVARLGRTCDTVLLLNWSKDQGSGAAFGRLVWEHVPPPMRVPMVQADRDFFIVWEGSLSEELASMFQERGLERMEAPLPSAKRKDIRDISGVRPGEHIWINGTVIGQANSDKVTIGTCDGHLCFEGVDVKAHGLEKITLVDLGRAIIRSGSVRRTWSPTRRVDPAGGNRLILVDHRGEDSIFRAPGSMAAVTVGDDTTRVCSALLARLGVPVIGIVDGDEDGICTDKSYAPGSVIVKLRPGSDDQLGEKVRAEIFRGGDETEYDGGLTGLAEHIARMAGPSLLEVCRLL
jgi:hypothetical protein